jgi:hypothetical protein
MMKYMGDCTEALVQYNNALAIHELVFGLEHPKTAGALQNIAGVLLKQEDFDGTLDEFCPAGAMK